MPRKKTRAAAPATPAIPSGFRVTADEVERHLVTGQSRGLLEDYFGADAYRQLSDMAREASTRGKSRGGPRVFILPGIMGSTLARNGNVLWLDPIEIALGRLTRLKLDGPSDYSANGVILLSYLKLKLHLKLHGFDAEFFPYDWRRSIADSGAALAAAILHEPAAEVHLVAHSMGGLVARAALPAAGKKVAKLIMLGTPNYGSFAPAQVIRGTYDVVQKLKLVDRINDIDILTDTFNTFPGLYEMLPAGDRFSAVDLYKAANWPTGGPQPVQRMLTSVKPAVAKLAPADKRFYLIAGINHETVTGVQKGSSEFTYETSAAGDGTVPLAFAKLDGIPEDQVYYVDEAHGSLPNNGTVEAAVTDLLAKGATKQLPNQAPALRRATRLVSEKELKEMAQRAPAVGALGTADFRHLLDAVAAPPSAERSLGAAAVDVGSSASGAALPQQFRHLTIGRRGQRRLEITLAHGSITDVDCRAYVLGTFRNVEPSGAAKAIDLRLDNAISEFTARRMFSGEMGSIFTVPVGRNQLPSDMVLFAGLGAFDRFTPDVQQLVAENVIRVLIRSRVDEFATVLIGAGTGQSTGAVVQNLFTGFLRGLKDADPRNRFRSITVCETNAARFAEMKSELYRLAGTALFEDLEITLDEVEIPPPAPAAATRVLSAGPEPVYLIVREEESKPKKAEYRISILGSGMKAAVVSAVREIDPAKLAALLSEFDSAVAPDSNLSDLQPLGKRITDAVLPAEICTVLESMKDRHIVVAHDAPTSRVPWETLTIDGWTPALDGGLSRRYIAEGLPVATWLESRRAAPKLQLLLVVNPLGDLKGADDEGERIQKLAGAKAQIEVQPLVHDKATKAAVVEALRSGKFDCVHYAGHAFFDPNGPSRSGLICAGKEILMGSDLAGIPNLPSLMFFNACEAGRVRGRLPKPSATARAAEFAGVAETLMRGGLANYLSTYWPVGDDSAEAFSLTFYQRILEGQTLGAAVLAGRQEVNKLKNRDWADYLLYGSYDFILKSGAK